MVSFLDELAVLRPNEASHHTGQEDFGLCHARDGSNVKLEVFLLIVLSGSISSTSSSVVNRVWYHPRRARSA